MKDDNKTRVEFQLFKGFKMESPTTKSFLHYVGVAIVLCAIAFVISAIAPNGFF